MKNVLLIGLGRFGRHAARRLNELGHQVMAVDVDEKRVDDALPYLTKALIGDSTDYSFMSSLGIRNFDLCIVAIGDNFQSSLETTSLLKELGAKMVISRAARTVHEKFLLRNGADEVVFAEKEMAERLAVKYSADNIFDYIQLTNEYAIYEIPTPKAWEGKTIRDKGVRVKYNLNILAIKRGGNLIPLPSPDYVFNNAERLIVMCRKSDIDRITH